MFQVTHIYLAVSKVVLFSFQSICNTDCKQKAITPIDLSPFVAIFVELPQNIHTTWHAQTIIGFYNPFSQATYVVEGQIPSNF